MAPVPHASPAPFTVVAVQTPFDELLDGATTHVAFAPHD
jgi:hypothetical protein